MFCRVSSTLLCIFVLDDVGQQGTFFQTPDFQRNCLMVILSYFARTSSEFPDCMKWNSENVLGVAIIGYNIQAKDYLQISL